MKSIKLKMESMMEKGELAGIAVVVIKNGNIIFNDTQGIGRILDGIKIPMENDNKFRIASISKVITTLGFMKLVEEGKISLDDNIEDYLNIDLRNPNFKDVKITPRMLLSHTSSIRDASYYSAPMPYTMKDFFSEGGKYYEKGAHYSKKLEETPGKYFCYANLNFGIIATIIEKITNMRFDTYMRKEIFEKLEIDASYNVIDFGKDIDKVGELYRKQNGEWIPQIDTYKGKVPEKAWYTYAIGDNMSEEGIEENLSIDKYIIGTNGTLFSPHGGVRISAEDLAKVMLMLINRGLIDGKRFLSGKTIEDMEESFWDFDGKNGDTMNGFMCNYGMSIHHLRERELKGKLVNIKRYIGHSGEAYGLFSGMYYNLEGKSGFVYYITGTDKPLDNTREKNSAFSVWEEEIIGSIIESF